MHQQRAAAVMEKRGLDGLRAVHPNHATYATNYGGHSPRIYTDRVVMATVPC